MKGMENIKICKGGIIKFIKEQKFHKINPDNALIVLLEDNFILEEGFKLYDYFKLFENYPLLIPIVTRYYIEDYLEEFHKSIKNIEIKKDEDYIFLKKTASEDILDKQETYINIDVSLYEPSTDTNYAIEMSPLKNLLGYNIKLIEDIEDSSKTIINENKVLKANWTVYEFITEIISELSFCGPPQERNEMSENLNKMVEEIENGTVELVECDLDELLKDIKDKTEDNSSKK